MAPRPAERLRELAEQRALCRKTAKALLRRARKLEWSIPRLRTELRKGLVVVTAHRATKKQWYAAVRKAFGCKVLREISLVDPRQLGLPFEWHSA